MGRDETESFTQNILCGVSHELSHLIGQTFQQGRKVGQKGKDEYDRYMLELPPDDPSRKAESASYSMQYLLFKTSAQEYLLKRASINPHNTPQTMLDIAGILTQCLIHNLHLKNAQLTISCEDVNTLPPFTINDFLCSSIEIISSLYSPEKRKTFSEREFEEPVPSLEELSKELSEKQNPMTRKAVIIVHDKGDSFTFQSSGVQFPDTVLEQEFDAHSLNPGLLRAKNILIPYNWGITCSYDHGSNIVTIHKDF